MCFIFDLKGGGRATTNKSNAPFQEAQQRLEEMHREKVTRVMKDWSDLEEKYQDMRTADPKSAQSFKQRMTSRFQVCAQPPPIHNECCLCSW